MESIAANIGHTILVLAILIVIRGEVANRICRRHINVVHDRQLKKIEGGTYDPKESEEEYNEINFYKIMIDLSIWSYDQFIRKLDYDKKEATKAN